MKRILTIAVMVVAGTIAANAQKVEVPQEFIDSASKSFMEVVLLRQAVVSQEKALAAKDETIKAKDEVIEAKNETIRFRDEQINYYRKLKCDETTIFFVFKNKRCH
jgi:hypothetical protein